MCNPVLALTAVSTAVTAAGQLQGGIYASQMARYRSQVAAQNKALAREGVLDDIAQGQDQQRQLGREVAGRVGSQEARMAANNIDPTFGSAARVILDTEMIGSEDSAALSENMRRQVRARQIDISNLESERRAAKAEARQAKIATGFAVATTFLGAAKQYADFKRPPRTSFG